MAENNKWDKKSGLLDQLACATGGMITIDFANYENPEVVKLDSKVIQDKYDFSLLLQAKITPLLMANTLLSL